jgi:hypothetical protein
MLNDEIDKKKSIKKRYKKKDDPNQPGLTWQTHNPNNETKKT